jgi:hypothetical protein
MSTRCRHLLDYGLLSVFYSSVFGFAMYRSNVIKHSSTNVHQVSPLMLDMDYYAFFYSIVFGFAVYRSNVRPNQSQTKDVELGQTQFHQCPPGVATCLIRARPWIRFVAPPGGHVFGYK